MPYGLNGQGYKIKLTRMWLTKSADVANFILQVASATLSTLVTAPLSGTALGKAARARLEPVLDRAVSKLQSLLQRLDISEGEPTRKQPQSPVSASLPNGY